MTLREYFLSLSDSEKICFSDKSGLSLSYIKVHLVRKKPTRTPKIKTLRSLSLASKGTLKIKDLIEEFYLNN